MINLVLNQVRMSLLGARVPPSSGLVQDGSLHSVRCKGKTTLNDMSDSVLTLALVLKKLILYSYVFTALGVYKNTFYLKAQGTYVHVGC